jgi:hypothetical protein
MFVADLKVTWAVIKVFFLQYPESVEKTTDFPTDSNFIDFLLIFHRFHCCFPVIAGAKAVLSTAASSN